MNLEKFKKLHSEKMRSNLSIKDFMTSKGLPVHQYYYWYKKMNDLQNDDPTGSFIQIMPNAGVSPVTLEYSHGVKISFNEMPSVKALVELVNIRK